LGRTAENASGVQHFTFKPKVISTDLLSNSHLDVLLFCMRSICVSESKAARGQFLSHVELSLIGVLLSPAAANASAEDTGTIAGDAAEESRGSIGDRGGDIYQQQSIDTDRADDVSLDNISAPDSCSDETGASDVSSDESRAGNVTEDETNVTDVSADEALDETSAGDATEDEVSMVTSCAYADY
jgi:hypothetical protein